MSVLSVLLSVMIALLIGSVAENFSPFNMPGGWIALIIVGFVGDWMGSILFGGWGPTLLGFSLIPALVGAFIIVFVVGLIADLFH